MAVKDEVIANILRANGVAPEMVNLVRAYTQDGWVEVVVYDEEAISACLDELSEQVCADTPQHITGALYRAKTYHEQRRRNEENVWLTKKKLFTSSDETATCKLE